MYVPPCTQVVSYGRLLKKSQVHESSLEVNYDLSKLRAAYNKYTPEIKANIAKVLYT